MSFLARVTPIVITWNEEVNVGRVLDGLAWADEVAVIDSGSTDRTLDIVASNPRARVLVRPFTSHSEQWNYALENVKSEWVLTLDADYILSEEIIAEMDGLRPDVDTGGYASRFVYCSLGTPLRGSLYPPKVVLFKRVFGSFAQEGHTQRLVLTKAVQRLRSPILHDDRKPLSRWLAAQDRYAALEAQRLLDHRLRDLDWMDRMRRLLVFAAPLAFVYSLLIKGTLLDGRAGLYYSLQRATAEGILAMKLCEAQMGAGPPGATGPGRPVSRR